MLQNLTSPKYVLVMTPLDTTTSTALSLVYIASIELALWQSRNRRPVPDCMGKSGPPYSNRLMQRTCLAIEHNRGGLGGSLVITNILETANEAGSAAEKTYHKKTYQM